MLVVDDPLIKKMKLMIGKKRRRMVVTTRVAKKRSLKRATWKIRMMRVKKRESMKNTKKR